MALDLLNDVAAVEHYLPGTSPGMDERLLQLTGLIASGGGDPFTILQKLSAQLQGRLWISSSSSSESEDEGSQTKVLDSQDLDGLVAYIEKKAPKNVICMVGAGLSTAAGIPDFRSPGTGLYDNLQRYNLPEPQAVFDLGFFRESPNAFYDLAKELWPTGEKYRPTKSHYFIKMLEEKGILLRCYTQNIDMLEQLAGIGREKIIAAHGNFAEAHTLTGQEVPVDELKHAVLEGVDACLTLAKKYGSLVKPDIVFFGESLPEAFHSCKEKDFPECDLLVVMGTSLAVAPFNQLIREVPAQCPRVLINRDSVGLDMRLGGQIFGGFRFNAPLRCRDVFLQGDCDARIQELCERVGWATGLERLLREEAAVCTTKLQHQATRKAEEAENKPQELEKEPTFKEEEEAEEETEKEKEHEQAGEAAHGKRAEEEEKEDPDVEEEAKSSREDRKLASAIAAHGERAEDEKQEDRDVEEEAKSSRKDRKLASASVNDRGHAAQGRSRKDRSRSRSGRRHQPAEAARHSRSCLSSLSSRRGPTCRRRPRSGEARGRRRARRHSRKRMDRSRGDSRKRHRRRPRSSSRRRSHRHRRRHQHRPSEHPRHRRRREGSSRLRKSHKTSRRRPSSSVESRASLAAYCGGRSRTMRCARSDSRVRR